MPQPSPSSVLHPRVVIVDADRRVQQSLAELLRVTGQIDVAGSAGDVRSALEEVALRRPDAVLVDPRLPDVEAGVALINGLVRAWPELQIVLTGWADTEGHGQPGGTRSRYVSKDGSPEDFVAAIIDACSTRDPGGSMDRRSRP